MKKLLTYVVAAMMIASCAQAQNIIKPLNLYLKGGVSLPQSDFESGHKMGYQGGAAIGLRLLPALEAIGCISYHSFSPDWLDDANADGGRFSVLMYGGEGKLNLGSIAANPFILAGAGVAKLDISAIDFENDDDGTDEPSYSETKSYFTIGAGLEFERLFVEARYVKILDDIDIKNISTDKNEEGTIVFIPISVGLRF